MKIAFYAPMKSPDHPVPSGDRLMAQMLAAALEQAGHSVNLVSELRSYSARPEASAYREIEDQADTEVLRLSHLWAADGQPDIWISYHPYYKAPDLLGPEMSERFRIPYVTVESSYSERRNSGYWQQTQDKVLAGLRQAAVNICLTKRDWAGIHAAAPEAHTAMLCPFIRPEPFLAMPPPRDVRDNRLVTVAMMRAGDKMNSYRFLADALERVSPLVPWTLSIVGDGAMQPEVKRLFDRFEADRIRWHGKTTTAEIAKVMSDSAVYVWPGYGEAYGLAYLEAQAAGLPVIAMNVAGVPEAVEDGVTGILTDAGDAENFAKAIERLLTDEPRRARMGRAARKMILAERTLDQAARALDDILTTWAPPKP